MMGSGIIGWSTMLVMVLFACTTRWSYCFVGIPSLQRRVGRGVCGCSACLSLLANNNNTNNDGNNHNNDNNDGNNNSNDDNDSSMVQDRKEMDASSSIRFLGQGPHAIVREGVVLVSPPEEYNHYLMRSSLFVYAMGMDEYNEPVIRCVVLDNPTPFTLGEMATGLTTTDTTTSNSADDRAGRGSNMSPLLNNLIYRGGNVGGETAMMLHSRKDLDRDEIGTSGIFEGGLAQALALGDDAGGGTTETQQQQQQAVDAMTPQGMTNKQFKFFFNYCQFSPIELETMLDVVDPETGDAWVSFEVPPEMILEEWDKNEFWRYLRNELKKRKA